MVASVAEIVHAGFTARLRNLRFLDLQMICDHLLRLTASMVMSSNCFAPVE
jgi:hypothetical protein